MPRVCRLERSGTANDGIYSANGYDSTDSNFFGVGLWVDSLGGLVCGTSAGGFLADGGRLRAVGAHRTRAIERRSGRRKAWVLRGCCVRMVFKRACWWSSFDGHANAYILCAVCAMARSHHPTSHASTRKSRMYRYMRGLMYDGVLICNFDRRDT